MTINQKNIFGNNVVNVIESRELTDSKKAEILNKINSFGAKNAVIRYEAGGETKEFAEIVGNFLNINNIITNFMAVSQSEIIRNQFTIEQHPSDSMYVIIKIGPIH